VQLEEKGLFQKPFIDLRLCEQNSPIQADAYFSSKGKDCSLINGFRHPPRMKEKAVIVKPWRNSCLFRIIVNVQKMGLAECTKDFLENAKF